MAVRPSIISSLKARAIEYQAEPLNLSPWLSSQSHTLFNTLPSSQLIDAHLIAIVGAAHMIGVCRFGLPMKPKPWIFMHPAWHFFGIHPVFF